MAVLTYWQTHSDDLWRLLGEHLALVVIAVAVAAVIGIPIGIAAARRPRIGGPLAAAASVIQTIPSLALFGFLLPLPFIGGIGTRTALIALFLYALLPLIRTTTAGLRAIDPAILDAADALGMSPRQRLLRVELPLALPSIVAGVRVAAVVAVGTVTIAAAIGAGGLGEYIYRGLAMVDATVILAGAIPVAVLALLIDGLLLLAERALAPRRSAARRRTAAVALLIVTAGAAALARPAAAPDAIVVGSKNFTEQVILGEIVAQALERAGVPVERRLNLGGTFICDRALRAGDIDVYVEYSGTALTAVMKEPIGRDPAAVLERVRTRYAADGLTVTTPFGFNNTFAVLVRAADAEARRLTRLSQLAAVAPEWRAAFGYEFLEREDGYRGLARTYGLRFREAPRAMDLTLVYRALADRQVDVVVGDATAGLVEALALRALEDDRGYFPPYDAVPVARSATLLRDPRVADALQRLGGRLDAATMRRMNHAVDGQRRDPAAVAREFLDRLDPGE